MTNFIISCFFGIVFFGIFVIIDITISAYKRRQKTKKN